jgi:hypothetical protein
MNKRIQFGDTQQFETDKNFFHEKYFRFQYK